MSYPYSADHPNVGAPDSTQSTPELPELLQESAAMDVKGEVKVVNVVRVAQLPSRHGLSSINNLQEGVALALFGANKRRRRAILIGIAPAGSTSRGFYVGQQDAVTARYSALWPYNVALHLENTEQVYVMPDGTGLATGHIISVISEDWAD